MDIWLSNSKCDGSKNADRGGTVFQHVNSPFEVKIIEGLFSLSSDA